MIMGPVGEYSEAEGEGGIASESDRESEGDREREGDLEGGSGGETGSGSEPSCSLDSLPKCWL